jgi:dTDP-4-dehydrorhamnose reductase
LGGALLRRLPEAQPGTGVLPFSQDDFDVTDKDAAIKAITESGAGVLINCAAYAGVDQAENEPEAAYAVNATASGYIAEACARAGIKLVHLSSDYVFNGEKDAPYTEDDTPCPIGAYAKSKADGDKEVSAKCPEALIVRSAWLFGHDGQNFVTTILEKGDSMGELKVINDQFGSPTYADDLALAIGRLIEANLSGIVNVVNSGYCSWYELAVEALRLAGKESVKVTPVDSDGYKTLATRPKNSRLDTSLYSRIAGSPLRRWREALKEFLKEAGGRP